jgi:hypothetical protein
VATATQAPATAMMEGFRTAFTWSAALTVAALLVSLFGRPSRPSSK